MDDLIVVRCNRDVSKSSLISHVTRTSSAYFETDGVERGERSLGDPGALADSEVWVLTDNGQMLKVADVNQVLPVKLIETASGERTRTECELSEENVAPVEVS